MKVKTLFDKFGNTLSTVFAAIVALAIVAVVLSKRSQTSQAISAISGAVATVVKAAVNPVTNIYGSGNNGSVSFTTPASAPLPHLA